ncbi:alpha/beta fold hydrolase [Luteibaculum oceani]|uniref:alpha/beta fold hydrolase n=1 Tax=Luteibaculum oceani TaxID=1294296 RepID=UPI00147712B2|nr:alpha/beta hydrolase [Luteibaculum oceani]
MLKFGITFILLSLYIGLKGQHITINEGIQKISNTALYYEYRFHQPTTNQPTIVFEAGARNSSGYWNGIIDSVSHFANTLRYDRAGLGRSVGSTDSIRSSTQIALELKALLDSLEIFSPLILVCHSAGGFYGRTFASEFKDRVRALVLIESSCDIWEDMLSASLTKNQKNERFRAQNNQRANFPIFQRLEYEAAPVTRSILSQQSELQIPVYIIHGNQHNWPSGYPSTELEDKWKVCQEKLLYLSEQSSLQVVNGAGHHIFSEFDLANCLKSKFSNNRIREK